jgi:hypothetical protein
MPTLTHHQPQHVQPTAAVQQSASWPERDLESRSWPASRSQRRGGREPTDQGSQSVAGSQEPTGVGPTRRVGETGSAGGPRRGGGPAAATDTGVRDEFPSLDVKQPAPTVDATPRAGRPERRGQQSPDQRPPPREDWPSDRGDGDERREDPPRRAVQDAFFDQGSELMASDAEVDRVVEKLYREVERKMRIERERRGL